MNIKLNYLYRDAGNYKLYDAAVFRNDVNLSLAEIEKVIKEHLIDGEFFDPRHWGIKKLSFENYDEELDHD